MGGDPLVGDLDALDPGAAVSRSAHPMPPESGPGGLQYTTGSSQNLQTMSSRRTCTCFGLAAVEAVENEVVGTRDVPDSWHSSITRQGKRRDRRIGTRLGASEGEESVRARWRLIDHAVGAKRDRWWPARQPALRHVIGGCEALIHHAPERSDGLGLVIEEILEEAGFAEGGWIGVSFPVVATFFNPVVRFTRIDTGE